MERMTLSLFKSALAVTLYEDLYKFNWIFLLFMSLLRCDCLVFLVFAYPHCTFFPILQWLCWWDTGLQWCTASHCWCPWMSCRPIVIGPSTVTYLTLCHNLKLGPSPGQVWTIYCKIRLPHLIYCYLSLLPNCRATGLWLSLSLLTNSGCAHVQSHILVSNKYLQLSKIQHSHY